MKKFCDFLKWVMIFSGAWIVGKTAFDFWQYKTHPEHYIYYSAPWYTGALVYGVFFLLVILICAIVRGILLRKLKKKEEADKKTPTGCE